MSPLSWPVLTGAALVGSPAIWAASVTGTLSPDVALVRLLICMAGVWMALSIVASLTESAADARRAERLRAAAEAEAKRLETQRPADVDLS